MQQLKVHNFEWTDHSVQSAGPSSRITDYGQRTAQNRRNGTTPCPLVGKYSIVITDNGSLLSTHALFTCSYSAFQQALCPLSVIHEARTGDSQGCTDSS